MSANEPRTKAGRKLWACWDTEAVEGTRWKFYLDLILAIESEAHERSAGAAPLDVEALANLWREEEVTDLDVDCPRVDYEETARAVVDRLPRVASLAPLLPDAEPERILREWIAAIDDVRASKRGANERLVQAQEDARAFSEGTDR